MFGKEMVINGQSVVVLLLKVAFDTFFVWLSSFSSAVLVAHNGRRFDFPVLVSACKSALCDEHLNRIVNGMSDTLNMLKNVFPKIPWHKQEELARALLNIEYDVHNAVEDARCKHYASCIITRLFV